MIKLDITPAFGVNGDLCIQKPTFPTLRAQHYCKSQSKDYKYKNSSNIDSTSQHQPSDKSNGPNKKIARKDKTLNTPRLILLSRSVLVQGLKRLFMAEGLWRDPRIFTPDLWPAFIHTMANRLARFSQIPFVAETLPNFLRHSPMWKSVEATQFSAQFVSLIVPVYEDLVPPDTWEGKEWRRYMADYFVSRRPRRTLPLRLRMRVLCIVNCYYTLRYSSAATQV
jgi:hypothetical protein